MKCNDSQELTKIIQQCIRDSGLKKIHIADKLGVSRQTLDTLIKKKNLGLYDMNKILDIIGYEVHIEVKKKD